MSHEQSFRKIDQCLFWLNPNAKHAIELKETIFFPYAVVAFGAIIAIYALLSSASLIQSSATLQKTLYINLPILALGMIMIIIGNILIKAHGKRQEYIKIIGILRKVRGEY